MQIMRISVIDSTGPPGCEKRLADINLFLAGPFADFLLAARERRAGAW